MDKNNAHISVGILYLNEPCFQESFQYFSDMGFQARILEIGHPNTHVDFLHVPDYKGFDTNGLGFRNYLVPPEYPPCSNQVRHFFDYRWDIYVNKGIPMVCFGHPFYMAASMLKNGNTPIFKLELSEGEIRFVSPIDRLASHDIEGVTIVDSRLIGGERFGLTEPMLKFMRDRSYDAEPVEITQLY